MPFGILFIFLLMLVGGVAAYWGDRVGMLVGRRRLSVFGLRPKYTSRVVAVATGVVIVLFTLSTMLILSNSVRRALFGMDELQDKVVALSGDVQRFEQKRADLEKQRAELERVNSELLTKSQKLEDETQELEAEKAALVKEKGGLKQEIGVLQGEISRAESQLSQAKEQLADLKENLEVFRFLGEQVFNVAQNLYGANFAVQAGDVLDTFLVDVRTGDRQKAIARLKEAVDHTEKKLVERGLGDPDTGVALRLDRIVQTDSGDLIPVSEDEVLAQAVQPLLQAASQGYQSVIVQISAVTNAREGDPVYADFRFFKNELVFKKGQVVSRHTFDPLRPRPELFDEFMKFVRVEIAQIARSRLLPLDGVYGEISYAEAYRAVDQIARHDKPVTVRAVAVGDTWAYESLDLRFEFQVGDAE